MDRVHLLPDWAKDFIEQDKTGALAEHRVSFLTQISSLVKVCGRIFLRGTFRFKDRQPSWNGLRDRVEAEFEERKANTSSLMTGL